MARSVFSSGFSHFHPLNQDFVPSPLSVVLCPNSCFKLNKIWHLLLVCNNYFDGLSFHGILSLFHDWWQMSWWQMFQNLGDKFPKKKGYCLVCWFVPWVGGRWVGGWYAKCQYKFDETWTTNQVLIIIHKNQSKSDFYLSIYVNGDSIYHNNWTNNYYT